jgi:hypothetical protein
MNLRNHKNSKKQGDAGLGIAIGWFAESGYTVSIPLTDSQDYDLIVDDGLGPKRVQVKTVTRHRYGGWVVELRTKGGNKSGTGKTKVFDPKKVDTLFIITANRDLYLLPSKNVHGESSISVGKKYENFRVK